MARASSMKAEMEVGAAVAASAVLLPEVCRGSRWGVDGLDEWPREDLKAGLCWR